MSYQFDRTSFKAQSFQEEQKSKSFSNENITERLRVSFYLNSIAYNFDINHPPKMDKSVFSMRKLACNG
jgi:hypothetical protein